MKWRGGEEDSGKNVLVRTRVGTHEQITQHGGIRLHQLLGDGDSWDSNGENLSQRGENWEWKVNCLFASTHLNVCAYDTWTDNTNFKINQITLKASFKLKSKGIYTLTKDMFFLI